MNWAYVLLRNLSIDQLEWAKADADLYFRGSLRDLEMFTHQANYVLQKKRAGLWN